MGPTTLNFRRKLLIWNIETLADLLRVFLKVEGEVEVRNLYLYRLFFRFIFCGRAGFRKIDRYVLSANVSMNYSLLV